MLCDGSDMLGAGGDHILQRGDMLCCRYIVHPDNRLTLRAQVEIKAGEEVTIVLSYQ